MLEARNDWHLEAHLREVDINMQSKHKMIIWVSTPHLEVF